MLRTLSVLALALFAGMSSLKIANAELFYKDSIDPKLVSKVGVPKEITPSSVQPTVTLPPRPKPVKVPIATVEEQSKLQHQIDLTVEAVRNARNTYDSYAITFVFISISLALAASVFGFLRKPVAAGILSLVVAASTGLGKVIPVTDRANYYRALYGQAVTLQIDTNLATKLTVADYNERISKLKTILIYASNLPPIGDVTPVTTELVKDIHSASDSKH
jgi:hypothetical protein